MRRPIPPGFLFVFLLFVLHFAPKPSESETDGNFRVGVVLNHDSTLANMSRLCLEMALSDFYLAHNNYKTKLALQFRFPRPGPVPAASAAVDLMVNERVHAILGPQTSDEAAFVALIGTRTKVPIISFSATSPSVSPKKTRFFVRAALNDSSQANATAALIRYFRWNQIVPVYELSEYGTGMMPYIVDAVKSVGVTVPYSISIPSSASDDFISAELYKAKSMEGRVFFVHMTKKLALTFFSKAKEAGMMTEGFAWILSEGLTSQLGTVDPTVLGENFDGVVGLKAYVSRTAEVADFSNRWRRKWRNEYPVSDISDPNVIGLWAYDSIWALASAAEKVGPEDPGYSGSSQNLSEVTDFSSIGLSKTGERLLEAILASDFEGMSGNFRLSGGELDNPVYEIVSVVGSSQRTIGYWTEDGLRKNLNNSTNCNMSTVVWPGDTPTVPKGWVYPTTGKKLQILVPGPVDPGFHAFLRADKDNVTNKVEVGGFVIEVFEAALKHLPYPVSVEYQQVSTDPKPTYNDLVRLISEKEYDGLVGDVTITANRSNFVDFTLPYTTTGVSMIVPLKDDRKMSAWFFRRPFGLTMWIVSGAFFIFTGLIVWVLEHQYNDDFRGPLGHQLGTAFFFIFSTLVFAHREKMKSNLSKIVLIIWMYVVLVLQSSYTASLTSMLTVKHLRPTTTDIRHLIENKENVGYLRSSFTKALLLGEGFKENQLKPFRSPQEYLEALNKGTKNGGVGAVVDEIPYLRLFLKDYCKNYTMMGNPYKAGGFGFVFPRGSSLVPDLSLAILTMGEGEEMIQIEKRWFGSSSSCTVEENSLTSERLTFANFWGLFLITGLASGIGLLAFFIIFLCQHQQELRGEGTAKEKLNNLWKRYQEKDFSSPTFRKKMKKSERSRNGDPSRSPLSCDCGRSAMQSPISTFMGRLGDGSGSPFISACSTPRIMLDRNKREDPDTDLISPLERGALSPKS